MKLPIDQYIELKGLFDSLACTQQRSLIAAHALQGLVAREPGVVSTEDEEDLAAQAVRLTDLVVGGLNGE